MAEQMMHGFREYIHDQVNEYAPHLSRSDAMQKVTAFDLRRYQWSEQKAVTVCADKSVSGAGNKLDEALNKCLQALLPQLGFMSGFKFFVLGDIKVLDDRASHGFIVQLSWGAA